MGTFLVIGASSGIGKRIAELLIEQNHNVFGTYNKNTSKVAGVEYSNFDAMNPDSLPEFEFEQLDALFYCPGSINLKPFRSFNEKDFIDDYILNVGGALRLIKKYFKALRSSNNSSIVLFSTIAVQKGFNFHSQVSSSKGAIEGLTRSLAAEFAPQIRVNAIAPSLTDTPLADKFLNTDQKRESSSNSNPLKRIGTVDDMANAAVFLSSEKASWINGQIIHIDGGMSTIKN